MDLDLWVLSDVLFYKQANEVVKANNLSDVVVVLHGRVEVGFSEQSTIPNERVDVPFQFLILMV